MSQPHNTPQNSSFHKIPLFYIGIFVLCDLIVLFQVLRWIVITSDKNYLCNPGISFGIILPEMIFIILWLGIISVITFLFWQNRDRAPWGYILILAGGFSNMLDRIFHGCVIDYIALIPWNTFNVADVSIFIGAILLLTQQYRQDHRKTL